MMGYGPAKPPGMSPRARGQVERAEALTGARNASPAAADKVAITREHVGQLGAVELQSVRVTAAPTAAQHNALVEDIRQIAALLNAMGAKFTGL